MSGDEQIPDTWLRANAYLDGELDVDDAARAEADPAVMAEITRLRALQASIVAVDPPTAESREAAIAAALAEFDAITPTAAGEAPAVVPFRPKPRYATWLGAAAAVVAIGLLGVLLTRVSGGGDDDDSGVALEAGADEFSSKVAPDADNASRATQEATAEAADAAGAAASTEAPMLAIDAQPEGAPAPEAAEATEAPAATDAPAATMIAADSAAGEGAPDASAVFIVLTDPITDDAVLETVGRRLIERTATGTPGTVPETPCDDDAEAPTELLGQGSLIEAGTARAVLVAIDRSTDTIVALDPASCVVLATGR